MGEFGRVNSLKAVAGTGTEDEGRDRASKYAEILSGNVTRS